MGWRRGQKASFYFNKHHCRINKTALISIFRGTESVILTTCVCGLVCMRVYVRKNSIMLVA